MNIEGQILIWIQENIRNNWLTILMKGISLLSNMGIMWIVLAALFLIVKKTRKEGVTLAIGLILHVIVCNVLLKNIVARPRPYTEVEGLVSLIGKLSDYSFPSGHTVVTFMGATVLYKKFPKYIGITAFIWAVITGFSRMYLGVHYLTDILGGGILGIILGYVVVLIVQKLDRKIFVKK